MPELTTCREHCQQEGGPPGVGLPSTVFMCNMSQSSMKALFLVASSIASISACTQILLQIGLQFSFFKQVKGAEGALNPDPNIFLPEKITTPLLLFSQGELLAISTAY